eukprot:Awhi_evm1s3623
MNNLHVQVKKSDVEFKVNIVDMGKRFVDTSTDYNSMGDEGNIGGLLEDEILQSTNMEDPIKTSDLFGFPCIDKSFLENLKVQQVYKNDMFNNNSQRLVNNNRNLRKSNNINELLTNDYNEDDIQFWKDWMKKIHYNKCQDNDNLCSSDHDIVSEQARRVMEYTEENEKHFIKEHLASPKVNDVEFDGYPTIREISNYKILNERQHYLFYII